MDINLEIVKTACVIQGDIRQGTSSLVPYMRRFFDVVILSTWQNEFLEPGFFQDCEIIFNEFPEKAGFSHRNYQRKSTAAGIKRAKELGCTHIMKWRTDMLPTKLNVSKLIKWSNYDVPSGVTSRIVTCAYRNYTAERDWFSSIPDLFAFGRIEIMELLWNDEGFDYRLQRNVPSEMIEDEGADWLEKDLEGGIWCAESELYGHFKRRLESLLTISLTHEQIAKNYMRLFDHNKLGVIWFGKSGFRPIFQAWEHNWWTEDVWNGSENVKNGKVGYCVNTFQAKLRMRLSFILSYYEIFKQKLYYRRLLKNGLIVNE